MKDGDYIQNLDEKGAGDTDKMSKGDAAGLALQILEDTTLSRQDRFEGYDINMKKADPFMYAVNRRRIHQTAEDILGSTDHAEYASDEFLIPPIDLDIYMGNSERGEEFERPRCPVIIGPKHSGKSEYALAQMPRPIKIQGELRAALEELDRVNGANPTHVVLDDVDLFYEGIGQHKHHKEAPFFKAITEIKHRAVIDARYKGRPLPAGLPRFFCNNKFTKLYCMFYIHHLDRVDTAVGRRFAAEYISYALEKKHSKDYQKVWIEMGRSGNSNQTSTTCIQSCTHVRIQEQCPVRTKDKQIADTM